MEGKITIIDGNDQITLSEITDNIKAYMVKGERGDDGVSPTVETSKTGDVSTITITDVNGIHDVEVVDGYNPTITTTESTGKVVFTIDDIDGTATTTISDPVVNVSKANHVATISVTDKNGTRSTTVADGADLTDGAVPTGAILDYDGTTIPGGYEEVSGKSIISVYPTQDLTLSSGNTYTLWEMGGIETSNGTKLTLGNDGKILIGAGVSKIRVSGQIYFYTGTANTRKSFQIVKNTTIILRTGNELVSNYNFLACSPRTFNVSQGDKISLEVSGTANDVYKAYPFGSYMEVEVIE